MYSGAGAGAGTGAGASGGVGGAPTRGGYEYAHQQQHQQHQHLAVANRGDYATRPYMMQQHSMARQATHVQQAGRGSSSSSSSMGRAPPAPAPAPASAPPPSAASLLPPGTSSSSNLGNSNLGNGLPPSSAPRHQQQIPTGYTGGHDPRHAPDLSISQQHHPDQRFVDVAQHPSSSYVQPPHPAHTHAHAGAIAAASVHHGGPTATSQGLAAGPSYASTSQSQQQQHLQHPQSASHHSIQPLSPAEVQYVDNGYVFDRNGRIVGSTRSAGAMAPRQMHPQQGHPPASQSHPPNQHPQPQQQQQQQQRSSPALTHAVPIRGGPQPPLPRSAMLMQPSPAPHPHPQQQQLQQYQQQYQQPQQRTLAAQQRQHEEQTAANEEDMRSIFHSYVLDYLQKASLPSTAHSFLCEVPSTPIHPLGPGQVHPASSKGKDRMYASDEVDHRTLPQASVQIESPAGFLFEWWTIFYEVFRQRSGPNGPLSTQSLVDMSHQAIEIGIRNGVPMRGPTPVGGQRTHSPPRTNGVPPNQLQQQPQSGYASQPPPQNAAYGGPPPQQPQRMMSTPSGVYQLGPPPSEGGPASGAQYRQGGTPIPHHAQIPGPSPSSQGPTRGVMMTNGVGPGPGPGMSRELPPQVQAGSQLPRQVMNRGNPIPGAPPPQQQQQQQQPQGGPPSQNAQIQAQVQLQQRQQQQQRFEAQAAAGAQAVAQQTMINARQNQGGPPQSQQQQQQTSQQQQQAAYNMQQHAQAQAQAQRQLGVGPRPGGVEAPPSQQHPLSSAAPGLTKMPTLRAHDNMDLSAHSSYKTSQMALLQQQIMLANRNSPAGPSPSAQQAHVVGPFAPANEYSTSPAKRFATVNGAGNGGSGEAQQQGSGVNASSPYANGAPIYGSPARQDPYGGNYRPVSATPAADLASPYAPNETPQSGPRARMTSFPTTATSNAGSPAHLHMPSGYVQPQQYQPTLQQAQGMNGLGPRPGSTVSPPQAIDPVVAQQQEISRSQQQAHQLEGSMAAPPLKNALTPTAGGPKTPAATPNANGLVAPETPSQYANSPLNLQPPTPQTSEGISPSATTNATTPGPTTGPKLNNTTAAKRKRETAKEATAAAKKQRASSAIGNKATATATKERQRSMSAASATTPATTTLPPTPSPVVVETPLPNATPTAATAATPSAATTASAMTATAGLDSTPKSNQLVASPENVTPTFFDPSTLDSSDPISKLRQSSGSGFYTSDDSDEPATSGAGMMTSDQIEAMFATSSNGLGSAVPDQGHFIDYNALLNGSGYDGFDSFDLAV